MVSDGQRHDTKRPIIHLYKSYLLLVFFHLMLILLLMIMIIFPLLLISRLLIQQRFGQKDSTRV